MEDAELIKGILAGREEAENALFKRYRPRLSATACHFLGLGDPEVEDMVQETFARALKGLSQFEGRSSLYLWLNHICVNLCYERFRHRKRQALAQAEELETMLGGKASEEFKRGEEEELKASRLAQLKLWTRALRGICAEMIRLRFEEGLALAGIKERLKIPMGTVASRLARCLESLKKEARTASGKQQP